MNPQSRGTVTLRSPDPHAAPLIDPGFLTHAFDRRVIIEGVRHTMHLLSAPIYAHRTIAKFGPTGETDEEIWVSPIWQEYIDMQRSSLYDRNMSKRM